MAHIEIKDLTFKYPGAEKAALDSVDLSIGPGEYVLLCGQSGSGKTTLLRHLKSPLAPAGERSGSVFYNGHLLEETDARSQASAIGYVMQNCEDQIVTDKVWHELAFGLESIGTDPDVMRIRVAEMANYFGISGWMQKDTALLSGGQKQLLNLASVMALQPEVLILDEPTSQLDPTAASDFLNTVRKINLELGITVIITDHRLEDIYPAADKVAVIEDGKIICCASPAQAAKELCDTNNAMFAALPAPVRIFYGSPHNSGKDICPLTVREGRIWLSETASRRQEKSGSRKEADELPLPKAAVSFENVWFRYEKEGDDILKGLTFDIPQNRIFAIVGENGSGKTTLLRTICRICRPYRGCVKINGKNISKYRSGELFKNNIAMLPQDPQSLFSKMTVREDLEEMLGTKEAGIYERRVETEGFDAVPLDGRVMQAAEKCRITELLRCNPYDLSGGEQQRVALAKVLLAQPEILLLDEPTKGMDNIFKAEFAGILKELVSEGKTVIIVSHDVEFCAKYADMAGMFFDGRIISSAPVGKFFGTNSFYTTAASRMARHIFDEAVTAEDVIKLLNENRAEPDEFRA